MTDDFDIAPPPAPGENVKSKKKGFRLFASKKKKSVDDVVADLDRHADASKPSATDVDQIRSKLGLDKPARSLDNLHEELEAQKNATTQEESDRYDKEQAELEQASAATHSEFDTPIDDPSPQMDLVGVGPDDDSDEQSDEQSNKQSNNQSNENSNQSSSQKTTATNKQSKPSFAYKMYEDGAKFDKSSILADDEDDEEFAQSHQVNDWTDPVPDTRDNDKNESSFAQDPEDELPPAPAPEAHDFSADYDASTEDDFKEDSTSDEDNRTDTTEFSLPFPEPDTDQEVVTKQDIVTKQDDGAKKLEEAAAKQESELVAEPVEVKQRQEPVNKKQAEKEEVKKEVNKEESSTKSPDKKSSKNTTPKKSTVVEKKETKETLQADTAKVNKNDSSEKVNELTQDAEKKLQEAEKKVAAAKKKESKIKEARERMKKQEAELKALEKELEQQKKELEKQKKIVEKKEKLFAGLKDEEKLVVTEEAELKAKERDLEKKAKESEAVFDKLKKQSSSLKKEEAKLKEEKEKVSEKESLLKSQEDDIKKHIAFVEDQQSTYKRKLLDFNSQLKEYQNERTEFVKQQDAFKEYQTKQQQLLDEAKAEIEKIKGSTYDSLAGYEEVLHEREEELNLRAETFAEWAPRVDLESKQERALRMKQSDVLKKLAENEDLLKQLAAPPKLLDDTGETAILSDAYSSNLAGMLEHAHDLVKNNMLTEAKEKYNSLREKFLTADISSFAKKSYSRKLKQLYDEIHVRLLEEQARETLS